MAELGRSNRAKADNNVYTVLAAIALVALLAGVIYVWFRSAALFDAANPFAPVSAAAELVRSVGLA